MRSLFAFTGIMAALLIGGVLSDATNTEEGHLGPVFAAAARHSDNPEDPAAAAHVAPSDVDRVCCYGNSTTRLDCMPFTYDTCWDLDNARGALGKCGDTPSPCDVGACCPPLDAYADTCTDISSFSGGVRGSCNTKGFTFYEGETCDQSCRTRSLGACCTNATPSHCMTGKTYLECVGDHYSPDSAFLGFAYNKTCDEVDCAQYGACCSSERAFRGNITWSCSPGCRSSEIGVDNNWADFVQGYTCPSQTKGCLFHMGACCYTRGPNRVCIDNVSRKACSNRPTYVSFHNGATCESIGNCSTTAYGACMSPPRRRKYGAYVWTCIPGDNEAMCFARYTAVVNDPLWFPQHAPGHSCVGYNTGEVARNNSILRQRGACWSINEATGARQCNNNMTRSVCMAKPGFLGFNASKLCTQTRTVTYGACCQPAIDEPLDPVANPSTPGPICTPTTESACKTLEMLTAWVKGKPCNGSHAATCSQDIKGACCYSLFKKTDECYATECFSTRCEDDVAWTDCVEAYKRDPAEEGGQALGFTTGATCAAVSCRLPWES